MVHGRGSLRITAGAASLDSHVLAHGSVRVKAQGARKQHRGRGGSGTLRKLFVSARAQDARDAAKQLRFYITHRRLIGRAQARGHKAAHGPESGASDKLRYANLQPPTFKKARAGRAVPGVRHGFRTGCALRERALREKPAAPTPCQEQSVQDGFGAEGGSSRCAYANPPKIVGGFAPAHTSPVQNLGGGEWAEGWHYEKQ